VTAAGEPPSKLPEAETVIFARTTGDPGVVPGATGAAPDKDRADSTRMLEMPRGRHRTGPVHFTERSTRRAWVSRAAVAAIWCVQALLSLRMHNTASVAEAQYLTIGHQEIAHLLHGAPPPANDASSLPGVPVLYPVLGAYADGIGGLAAARAVSLVAMLLTTALLYTTTRRLFNEQVGVYAAALFAATEAAVLAGNLATPDATSLCLLALACWIVVRTASWRWPAYLLAVPAALLAVGTCYWALLCLPTLGLLGVLAALPYLRLPALSRLLVPAVLIGAIFATRRLPAGPDYLKAAVAATASRSHGSSLAPQILADGGKWGGLLAALAVFGAVRYVIQPKIVPGEDLALAGTAYRRTGLGVVLTATAGLALADQLYLNSENSLDTHLAFGLFFAAPMAGAGLASLVGEHYRRAQIAVLAWTAALILGLVQSGQIFGSWPNSAEQVRELSHYLGPGDRYLVENDGVAIYYLRGNPDAEPGQFTSTSLITYRAANGEVLTGTTAYVAALRADYFHVVIYDSTVTSTRDISLAAELISNPGYRLVATLPEQASGARTTCYVWVRTSSGSGATHAPAKRAPHRADRSRAVTSHQ
jgi:Dolichyl-phosphate-mannose-protein mannosyltransferase